MGRMAGDVPESIGELPMITYLRHDQIDKTRWDECIAHAVNGLAYAWSWVLDVVHPQWEALVEMDADNYLIVMPITNKRKYGIHYLCQPFFTQQLGVFSRSPLSPQKLLEFLQAIPKKYRLVEIRLNESNVLDPCCKGMELHRNHLLDLRDDYDTLSSRYHENTRRNLKKSLKHNLRLDTSVPIQTVIQLFRSDRGASVTHWGDPEYARLEALTLRALSSSNAFVYGVKNSDNESIICGALFLLSHARITFLFSGNSITGKETQAMTFLIDQVLRQYAGHDLTFDFEGSDDDALARFYQGFGSTPISYPSFTYRFCNPLR